MKATVESLRTLFPSLMTKLPEAACQALADALRPESHAAGANLVEHGTSADALFFVASGLLSIRIEQDGEKLLLGQAGKGAVVGEVGMIEPGPASATLHVIEDVEVWVIDHQAFQTLGETNAQAASHVLKALSTDLAKRLRHSSEDLIHRIDDHEWMRSEAKADRPGWLARLTGLLMGNGGAA